MASNVEQHVVIKFLVNIDVKPDENYSHFLVQYSDEILTHSITFESLKYFKEGCPSLSGRTYP